MHELTVRMPVMIEDMHREFHGFYTWEDARDLLRNESAEDLRPAYYAMLDEMGIIYEKNKKYPYYRALLEASMAVLPKRSGLTGQMICFLRENFTRQKNAREYMTQLVDRLADPEDCALEGRWDTTRLKILRRFLRMGIYGHAAGLGTEKSILQLGKIPQGSRVQAIRALEDSVFQELEEAMQEAAKADKEEKEKIKERLSIERGDLGLLRLANDLAMGYFPAGNSVRRNLYYFAIAFDMTVYTGHKGELRDPDRDLERNLFSGYYDNNLMEYMAQDYEARVASGGYEGEPTGLGINCKNGPEMILLYYLYSDWEPKEKIRRANQMIRDLEKEQKNLKGEKSLSSTRYYKDSLSWAMRLEEPAFAAYLREYYDFRRQKGDGSRYGAGTKQQTPAQVYQMLLEQAREAGLPDRRADQGLWIFDSACDLGRYRSGADTGKGKRDSQQAGFWRVLEHAHDRLQLGTKTGEPTRTDLMALYYQLFLEENWDTGKMDKSLPGFLEQFVHGNGDWGLNSLLKQAGYLPWRSQNLWDVLVAFSAYAVVCLGE